MQDVRPWHPRGPKGAGDDDELPAAAVARVEGADVAQVELWGERVLTARTLADDATTVTSGLRQHGRASEDTEDATQNATDLPGGAKFRLNRRP